MSRTDSGRMNRGRVWGAGFGVATLLTLLFPTQNFMALRAARIVAERAGGTTPPEIAWHTLLLGEIPVWYTWLLVTPVVFYLARRFPLAGGRGWLALPVHLLASLVLTAVVIMITTAVQLAIGTTPPQLSYAETVSIGYLTYFAYFLVIYSAIVTVYHAVAYYGALQRRELQASQLEAQLAHAQLSVLKMQLQPHFLFNTLNSIASLMFKDRNAAQRTIVLLADLLRLSLENASHHEVELRSELEFLDRYLEIQRLRFRDRLEVEYEIDPETERLLVPRLLLQPLVENAIRHGVERRVGRGRIAVSSSLHDGRVRLEVRDNGPGLGVRSRPAKGGGIGLHNVRLRLQQLYGPDHTMELENVEPTGLSVRIEIPRRASAAAPDREAVS